MSSPLSIIAGILGERIRYDLRKKLFHHLQTLSLPYYNRTPVGWIISRVTSDTDRVAELVTWGLLDVTWSMFNIVTALFFMSRINWQLTLIVMLIVPVIIVVATIFQRKIIVQYRDVRRINSKITGAYNETITGVRVIKALDREDANLAEFGQLTGDMYRAGYRAAWLSALFLPTVQLIASFATAAVILYAGLNANDGAISIGGIQAFISYIIFMIWPIQEMARVFAEMQQAIASGERIFSLLDSEPDMVDKPGSQDPGTLRGEIVFDHVEFYYEEGKPVLSDFNLRVAPGETIALVGPTGGGKTHDRQPALPLLRAARRRDHDRRCGLHRHDAACASSRGSASCCRRRTSSRARSARTSATGGWTRPTPRSRRRRKVAGAARLHRAASRRGTTSRWARAACCSRRARSS